MNEIQTQLEDDIDTEIENLRRNYEEKLTYSREMTLKLKGENGIMKKKCLSIAKEIDVQKDEIEVRAAILTFDVFKYTWLDNLDKVLTSKDKEYFAQIDILEKEIKAHKKDIKSRDVNITEKEKKIYDMKKRNQVYINDFVSCTCIYLYVSLPTTYI